MLLLSGCSFVDNPHLPYLVEPEQHKIRTVCYGGAGNTWISRSVMENISGIKQAIVLWTGFSRIDLEIPVEMLSDVEKYYQDRTVPVNYTKNNQTVWFHSGGWDATWCNWSRTRYAEYINKYMKSQYKPMNWQHHTDRNLLAIAGCLNTLEAHGIEYRFGFIADIFKDHGLVQGSLGGAVDPNDPLLDLIDFDRCFKTNPYDYCLEHDLLSSDGFHPSFQGYATWWQQEKQNTSW